MLNDLKAQIKKTGGSRQRTEGVKLIKRIDVRIREYIGSDLNEEFKAAVKEIRLKAA